MIGRSSRCMDFMLRSEIARLVYGYLQDNDCAEVAQMFLETSPYMSECKEFVKSGRTFNTRVMGATLHEFLDRVPQAARLVMNELRKPELDSSFASCLSSINDVLLGKDPDDATVERIQQPISRILTTTTTTIDESDSAADSRPGTVETGLRAVKALLSNTELHEKLAENINKVFHSCSVDEESTHPNLDATNRVDELLEKKVLETFDHTEKDPVFERLLIDLVGPSSSGNDLDEDIHASGEMHKLTDSASQDQLVDSRPPSPPLIRVTTPVTPVQNNEAPPTVDLTSSPTPQPVVLPNANISTPAPLQILTIPSQMPKIANVKPVPTRAQVGCMALPLQKTTGIVTRSSRILTKAPLPGPLLLPRPPPPPICIEILDDEAQNAKTGDGPTEAPISTSTTAVSAIRRTGVRARGGKRSSRGGRNVKVHVPRAKRGAGSNVQGEQQSKTIDSKESTRDVEDEIPPMVPPARSYAVVKAVPVKAVAQESTAIEIPPSPAQVAECPKEHSSASLDLPQTNTPHQTVQANVLKGKSLSTPRKKSHVRTLEFGSPAESAPLKRCLTSPKGCRSSPPLNLDKVKRTGLFKSPAKEPQPPPSSSLKPSWDAALRKCFSGDEPEDIPTSVGLQRKKTPVKKPAPGSKRKAFASRRRRSASSNKAGSSTPELSIISEGEEKAVESAITEKPESIFALPKEPLNDSGPIETSESTPPSNLLNLPSLETSTPLKPLDSLPPGFDPHKTPFMTPISKIIHEETSAIVKLLTPTSLMTPALNRFPDFDMNSLTNSPGALERTLIRECSRIEHEVRALGPTSTIFATPSLLNTPEVPLHAEPVTHFSISDSTPEEPCLTVLNTNYPLRVTEPLQLPPVDNIVKHSVASLPREIPAELSPPVQPTSLFSPQVETPAQSELSTVVETHTEQRQSATVNSNPLPSPKHVDEPRVPPATQNSDSSDESNSDLINRCISLVKHKLYSADPVEPKSLKVGKKKRSRSKKIESRSRKKTDEADLELRKPPERKKKKAKLILSSSTEDDDISPPKEQATPSTESPQVKRTPEIVKTKSAKGKNEHRKKKADNASRIPPAKAVITTLPTTPETTAVTSIQIMNSSLPDVALGGRRLITTPALGRSLGSKSTLDEIAPSQPSLAVQSNASQKTLDSGSRLPKSKKSTTFSDYSLPIMCNNESGLSVQRVLKVSSCYDLFELPRDLPENIVRPVPPAEVTPKVQSHSRPARSHTPVTIRQSPRKRKRNDIPQKKEESSKKPRIEPDDRKVEEKEFKRRPKIDSDEDECEPPRRRRDRVSGGHRDFPKNRKRHYDSRSYDRRHWASPSPSSSRRYSGRPPWHSTSYHRSHRSSLRSKKSPHRTPKEKFSREDHKTPGAKRDTRDVIESKTPHSLSRGSLEDGEISENSSMPPAIQFQTNDMKITVETNRLTSGGEDTKALLKRVDLEKFLSFLHGSTNSKS